MVNAPDNRLYVVVGVLINADGKLLIQQRPDGTVKAGKWEFPGGKLESGETPEQGLVRELSEELGITVCQTHPLTIVTHDYDHARVWLDTYIVDRFAGDPSGFEGQKIAWVGVNNLKDYDLLPAALPIIEAYKQHNAG